MKFSVNTTALAGLPGLLERRRDNLLAGAVFVDANTTITAWDQGLINQIRGTHERIVAEVTQFLRAAAEQRADPYADAVARAVAYYERTDIEAAARLDATMAAGRVQDGYPGLPQPQADAGLDATAFADSDCGPGYVAPHDYRFDYEVPTGGLDLLSPTSYARALVWEVTGFLAEYRLLDHPVDIMQEYLDKFAGDWATFRACADVWDSVANELDYVTRSLYFGESRTALVWTGEAAGRCEYALDVFGDDLHAAAGTLRAAAANYREVAEQMKKLTEAIIAAVTIICDYCADELANGLAPGVGEVLAAENLIVDARRLLLAINKAKSIVVGAVEAVDGFIAGTGADWPFGVLGNLGPLRLTPVAMPHLPGVATGARTLVAR
ncbi:MAG TPA: hypothetical protein VHA75_04210 [Rugosimonospora sp.]|nr:hypothetical protein [Rugosimonospora sp.]